MAIDFTQKQKKNNNNKVLIQKNPETRVSLFVKKKVFSTVVKKIHDPHSWRSPCELLFSTIIIGIDINPINLNM